MHDTNHGHAEEPRGGEPHGAEPHGGERVDLSQFDEDYAEAPVEDREIQKVPDGKYQVNVEKVEIARAKTSGNPMLKWTLRILGPQCRGRLLWRNNVLATRENLKWLKSDLHVCGLDLAKVSDLNDRVHELLDVKLEVTKRTKGENENVYFNRRIVLDDAPAAGGAGGDPAEIAPF